MKTAIWILGCLAAIGAGGVWADVQEPVPPPAGVAAPVELLVDLTCVLPADGPAVERGTLMARLY